MTRDDVMLQLISTASPTIIDIGSNEGQSIDHFISLFKSARVFGFEPVPALADALAAKYRDHANVAISRQAVSEKPGQAEFFINDFSQSSSLHAMDEGGAYRALKNVQTRNVVPVEVTTIDAFCESSGIEHLDYLKIDAQANSAPILRGAANLLGRKAISVLQIEVLFHNFYSKTESFYDIDRILYPLGYKLYTLFHTDSDKIGEFAYSFKTGEIWYLDAIYVRDQQAA